VIEDRFEPILDHSLLIQDHKVMIANQ